ncbi:MAG: hypothetical protein IJP03_06310, partial [Christensenellaceae bacterium]|nr:hypothetical protein [Christensenellaceae bacterium]
PAMPACWKANGRGVDLNRNYPCLFAEKQSAVLTPSAEGYKGPFAASEAETRAIMRWAWEGRFRWAITLHAKGEEILYADAASPRVTQAARKLAEAAARVCGYALAPISCDAKKFGAGFENWFRLSLGRPCLLFELAPYDGPLPCSMADFAAKVWPKMRGVITALEFAGRQTRKNC